MKCLPCPFLAFAGGLFQQPFEGGALHIQAQARPFFFVDEGDEFLQIHRVIEAAFSAPAKISPSRPFSIRNPAQRIGVDIQQLLAAEGFPGRSQPHPLGTRTSFSSAILRKSKYVSCSM